MTNNIAVSVLAFLIIYVALVQSYTIHHSLHRLTSYGSRRAMSLPMFGSFKKKDTPKKVVIEVDNKVITSEEASVNLRKTLIANNIDVYPLKAKITGNCGGAGICGTCAVRVLEGIENFNPPSKNEQNTIKEKRLASDLRLSCCSRISGPIKIKTKP